MTRPAYLVPHTHWDREWYRTYQQFRLDLVRTVDGVLSTLEHDPSFTHFLLDGQTIVLDDYLAMRPERADDLRALIAAGRLAVGPWYCHPDLFLVSGEALIRNLQLGLTMARAYGRSLMVGYIPDQFGHTAQLPQILRGFGIDSAVLWRGVDARQTPNESLWAAPDGSTVVLILLAQSYSNAQMLPLDPEALAQRLRQLCTLLAPGATGPGVLLMNGNDHLPLQAGLSQALAAANTLLAPDWQVEIASLDEAVARLRGDGNPSAMLHGELRSPATAHLLPGVLSARLPLKRRNTQMQLLLEREAEPYAAWAALYGEPYPHGELAEAWRLLLQNHPHDSICGCSIDAVHREMGTRFDGVEQIGGVLVERALAALTAQVDTRPPESVGARGVPLLIFNPGAGPRSERVRLSIGLPGLTSDYRLLDAHGQAVPHRWVGGSGEPSNVMQIPRESIPGPEVLLSQADEASRMMGVGLQRIEAHVDPDGLHIEVTVGTSELMTHAQVEAELPHLFALLDRSAPAPVTLHIHRNVLLDLELLVRDLPGYSYTTLWLQPGNSAPEATPPPDLETTPLRIENALVAVEVDAASGALTVLDRVGGLAYAPCNLFSDGGDAGDSYTFAAPATDTSIVAPSAPPTITVTRNALGATMQIEQEFSVPSALDEGRQARAAQRVPLRIDSVVTLTAGSPRIDITTTIVNTAADHRLRVSLQAPFAVEAVEAAAAFAVVSRLPGAPPVSGEALEDPVPTAPQQGYLVLREPEGRRGLVVANLGLPEYEAAVGAGATTVWLTLLRCVGWLSRDDLPTRRGGAGPALPVPEAQCPGTQTASYSLIPFAGESATAIAQADNVGVPLRATAPIATSGTLPSSGSFLHLDGPELCISAIKGAHDRQGLVVRLYNRSGDTVHGTLRLARPLQRAERLSLDELTLETLHDGGTIEALPITVGPYRIETLRLMPATATL